jgi:hypothetical protein
MHAVVLRNHPPTPQQHVCRMNHPNFSLPNPMPVVACSTNMLANAKATMDAAREKGVLICHCPITCEQQQQCQLHGNKQQIWQRQQQMGRVQHKVQTAI